MCLPLGPRLIFQIQFEVDVLIGTHLSCKHRPAPPPAPLGAARGAQLSLGHFPRCLRVRVCVCTRSCACVRAAAVLCCVCI